MYVHIGGNYTIPIDSIITMVHATAKDTNKSAIQYYDSQIINLVDPESVSTYIVTDECVYGSGISLKTLTKRINEFYSLLR